MIQVEDVTKLYGEQQAVTGLSFHVTDGEILGLIGPNGAGKTTTIRILCGVVKPDAGKVRVAGYDPGKRGDEVRSKIGVLTETAALYPNLSGIENLRFFAELYGVDDPDRPDELIEEFGLGEHKNRKAGKYSTGMKKRLGLAKALLHKPSILLLDEPTSGLDPAGIAMVLEEIERLSKEKGVTVVLCSHVLHQLETVCRRYVIIDKGQALAQGTVRELAESHPGPCVVDVDTDYALEGDACCGVPAKRLPTGRIQFIVLSRDEVPRLIRELSQNASVYSVTLKGEDLQSAYFRLTEGAHDE
jgi:ABC-2 type transport system ATP-binding protein